MRRSTYDSVRVIWRLILQFSPTCDLQWELSRRPGVESAALDPNELRTFTVTGPTTVSINVD
jgi:hypothetical protein